MLVFLKLNGKLQKSINNLVYLSPIIFQPENQKNTYNTEYVVICLLTFTKGC